MKKSTYKTAFYLVKLKDLQISKDIGDYCGFCLTAAKNFALILKIQGQSYKF
jgi:hypothetical protein